MSKLARAPLKLHPGIAIPVIAVCIALIVWLVSFVVPFALAAQAYAILLALLSFRYWPPMTQWVQRMPLPHRLIFGVLIGSMILGHLTIRSAAYFPFIGWEIFPFAREEDPVTCRELIATTASGQKVRLLVEQLYPSIVQISPLNENRPDLMEHLVKAMARTYNEHHALDPVRHVDLMVMAVKLHPPANESRAQPSCELLKRFDISSGH